MSIEEWIEKIVFPAYAGMIPIVTMLPVQQLSVPRIRGDDPLATSAADAEHMCSPHTRG